jgi:hypothetical protein
VNRVANKFAAVCGVAALMGLSIVSRAWAAPPDLSGVWIPDVKDQKRQETANMPPWKPELLPQVQHMVAEEKARPPAGLFRPCRPFTF